MSFTNENPIFSVCTHPLNLGELGEDNDKTEKNVDDSSKHIETTVHDELDSAIGNGTVCSSRKNNRRKSFDQFTSCISKRENLGSTNKYESCISVCVGGIRTDISRPDLPLRRSTRRRKSLDSVQTIRHSVERNMGTRSRRKSLDSGDPLKIKATTKRKTKNGRRKSLDLGKSTNSSMMTVESNRRNKRRKSLDSFVSVTPLADEKPTRRSSRIKEKSSNVNDTDPSLLTQAQDAGKSTASVEEDIGSVPMCSPPRRRRSARLSLDVPISFTDLESIVQMPRKKKKVKVTSPILKTKRFVPPLPPPGESILNPVTRGLTDSFNTDTTTCINTTSYSYTSQNSRNVNFCLPQVAEFHQENVSGEFNILETDCVKTLYAIPTNTFDDSSSDEKEDKYENGAHFNMKLSAVMPNYSTMKVSVKLHLSNEQQEDKGISDDFVACGTDNSGLDQHLNICKEDEKVSYTPTIDEHQTDIESKVKDNTCCLHANRNNFVSKTGNETVGSTTEDKKYPPFEDVTSSELSTRQPMVKMYLDMRAQYNNESSNASKNATDSPSFGKQPSSLEHQKKNTEFLLSPLNQIKTTLSSFL